MSNHYQARALRIVILLVIILACSGAMVRAAKQVGPDVWFNVESSPLEIRFSPSQRDVELFNRSFGYVIRYGLGCVRPAQPVKVVRRLPLVRTDLEPGKLLINSISRYTSSAEQCSQVKGSLAVIEVSFRDGSVWRIK